MELKVKKDKESKISFPVIKKKPLPNTLRSIDEIDEWIEHDYKLFFDREAYEKKKRLYSVNKPFVL